MEEIDTEMQEIEALVRGIVDRLDVLEKKYSGPTHGYARALFRTSTRSILKWWNVFEQDYS